ncbi:hypothetical protein JKP88DRAFT_243895 [Tribonema minus]|uniref:Uncharacterized protein n=1 Tax=Tribonema minus TaxID=303371 RepID=A0A835ZEC3_9STRA|nr:hypothetical protein JKP88DRAFT_243895 [Tribonema minus]
MAGVIEAANAAKPRFPVWPSVQGLMLPTSGGVAEPVQLEVMRLTGNAVQLLEDGDAECARSLADAAEGNMRVSAMEKLLLDGGTASYRHFKVYTAADPRPRLHPQVRYLRYNNNESCLCAMHSENFGDYGYIEAYFLGGERGNLDTAALAASMPPNPFLPGVRGPVLLTAMEEDQQLHQPMIRYYDLPVAAVTGAALQKLSAEIVRSGAQRL